MVVNMMYLSGQGCDGAANMAGRLNGVQAVIQQQYPAAVYTYCARHSSNLAHCDSCTLPATCNAVGTVQEVCAFFRKYGHRTTVLKK